MTTLSRRTAASALAALAGTPFVSSACDVLTGGCGDELRDEPPANYSAGAADGGIYQSTSWEPEDWLEFPPGLAIRFQHKLGTTPRSWQAYVATAREGDGATLVLAAGNEVELEDIDEEAVTVRNATCVDFFIVLVVHL